MHAVRGIDLLVPPGSATALVGESGSGKSTAALSIMRLVQPPIGEVVERRGSCLDGRDLLKLGAGEMRKRAAPRHRLHPAGSDDRARPAVHRAHADRRGHGEGVAQGDATTTIVALLERLGVLDARHRLKSYPHEFSGGMRQRVAIAIALAKEPRLLIADEPTTALDVTTQVAILRLLDELRRERDLALLFVTHDLAVARLVCQDLAVMYAGIVVESGPIDDRDGGTAAPVHPGPARRRLRPRRAAEPAAGDPRPAAAAVRPAARVPVRPALPARRGALHARPSRDVEMFGQVAGALHQGGRARA